MSINHLPSLDYQRDIVRPELDHRLPGCRQSQQRRQSCMLRIYPTVGQANEAGFCGARFSYIVLQPRQCGLRSVRAVECGKGEFNSFACTEFSFQRLELAAIEQWRVE